MIRGLDDLLRWIFLVTLGRRVHKVNQNVLLVLPLVDCIFVHHHVADDNLRLDFYDVSHNLRYFGRLVVLRCHK